MVRPLVALDVEERVPVPQLLLPLLAEWDAGALTVPDQDVAGEVVELAAAAEPVATRLPGYARGSLREQISKSVSSTILSKKV